MELVDTAKVLKKENYLVFLMKVLCYLVLMFVHITMIVEIFFTSHLPCAIPYDIVGHSIASSYQDEAPMRKLSACSSLD